MSEERNNENSFVGYEYKDVTVSRQMEPVLYCMDTRALAGNWKTLDLALVYKLFHAFGVSLLSGVAQ